MNQCFSFQQGWKFVREDIPEAVSPSYPLSELAGWEAVTLPHSVRYEPYDNHKVPTWQGAAMYRKHFPMDAAYAGKPVFLEFEAVMGVTDVWLNGELLHTRFGDAAPDQDGTVHTNCGGYLPFVVELTPFLRFNADNVLTVRTDNRDAPQVPPGKPQALLDFTYFGGIYRSVWLHVCESVHITSSLREDIPGGGGVVWQTPFVSRERAEALVRTHIRNSGPSDAVLSLNVWLEDDYGAIAASAQETFSLASGCDVTVPLNLHVDNPRLWSLDCPNLYTLICTLCRGGQTLHCHKERVGIRSITVDRKQGVLLNGVRAPLLSGVNRHQDYPILGNAAPTGLQAEDARFFKSAGFNVVRAAHYPMAEDFLAACDALGILLIEATPGWQWYPSGDDVPFTARVHQNIRQMVRRDRNHPCILAYETVLNETYHIPHGYTRRMEEIALEESSDARVAAESYSYDARPEANGVDRLASLIYGFDGPLEKTQKALMFLREYGDSWQEAYSYRMSRRVTRGGTSTQYPGGETVNLEKARNLLYLQQDGLWTLADCWAAYRESATFAGCAVWTGIDSRGMGSELSPCGVWDAFRLPKTACFAMASQRPEMHNPVLEALGAETGPLLHVADSWLPGSSPRTVEVYSNAARVTLQVRLEDMVLYEQNLSPMNCEPCAQLPHPPFRFSDVPYVPGSHLEALALDTDGRALAHTVVRTPGKPHHILLEKPCRQLLAGGSDLIRLYAYVVDEHGVLCPQAEPYIWFTLDGCGEIVGADSCLAAANPARAEAGIAAIYLRGGAVPGQIRLLAQSTGLVSAKLCLNTVPDSVPQFPFTPLPHGVPRFSGSYNLCDKLESGGRVCSVTRNRRTYPRSVILEPQAVFRLEGCYTWLHGCVSLRRGARLRILAEGVLLTEFTRSGQLSLRVPGVRQLTLEAPDGAVLLSPFLSDQPVSQRGNRVDLAARKRCTASSNAADAQKVMQKGHPWQTLWVGESTELGPQYFQVDLGAAHDVRDAMVYIGGQMGSDCTNYTYEIQTSQDGLFWQTRCRTRRTSWSNGVIDEFCAPEVRYVRIVFIHVDGGLLPAVSKIEIYADTAQTGG